MVHLIDKDALENILRVLWKEDDGKNSEHRICYNKALQDVQYEIDTLEVKEVDLDKEVDDVMKRFLGNITCREEQLNFAKHFFELSLKARTDKELVEEVYSHIDSVSTLEI